MDSHTNAAGYSQGQNQQVNEVQCNCRKEVTACWWRTKCKTQRAQCLIYVIMTFNVNLVAQSLPQGQTEHVLDHNTHILHNKKAQPKEGHGVTGLTVSIFLQMSGIPITFHLGEPPSHPVLNEAFPEKIIKYLLVTYSL